jgi:hypothetical protein
MLGKSIHKIILNTSLFKRNKNTFQSKYQSFSENQGVTYEEGEVHPRRQGSGRFALY